MKKNLFILIIGLMWGQALNSLAEISASWGRFWTNHDLALDLALASVQDVILFAVAAVVLAIPLGLSNYEKFSRRELLLAVAPLAIVGVVGLFVYSSHVRPLMFGYQLLGIVGPAIVAVIAVPWCLALMNKWSRKL